MRFLPNPHYEPRPAAADRTRPADRRVHRPRRRARRVLRPAAPAARLPAAAVPGRGQGAPGGRDRLHRRAPPLGGDRRAPGRAATAPPRVPRATSSTATSRTAGVIDHVGFEVADLARSAAFYDAVLFALGRAADVRVRARDRLRRQRARVLDRRPRARARARLRAPGAAARAARPRSMPPTRGGLANGGSDDGPPGRGPSTAGGTTPPTCGTPTGSGSRSSQALALTALRPRAGRRFRGSLAGCHRSRRFCLGAQLTEERSMPVRVGINGFGRIGRNVFRAAVEARSRHRVGRAQRPDRCAETLAHLLKYDSNYGPFPGDGRGRPSTGFARRRQARSACSPSATRRRCRGASSAPTS